jgi:hypothetical protein
VNRLNVPVKDVRKTGTAVAEDVSLLAKGHADSSTPEVASGIHEHLI